MKPHWSRTVHRGRHGRRPLSCRRGRACAQTCSRRTIHQAGEDRRAVCRRAAAPTRCARFLQRDWSSGSASRSSSRTAPGRAPRSAPPPSRARSPTATRCSRPRARRSRSTGRLQEAGLRSDHGFLADLAVAAVPFVLVVNPSLPVNTVNELVALAKTKPGELSYASGGVGALHHIYMRAVHEHDRHRHEARSVSRRRAGAQRRGRRPCAGHVRRRRAGDRR